MKVKVGSIISREDAVQGLAIRRVLEKTAGKGAALGTNAWVDALNSILTSKPKIIRRHRPRVAGGPTPPPKASPQDKMREQMQGQIDKLKEKLVASSSGAAKKEPAAKSFKLDAMMSDPIGVLHRASPFIATEPHVAAATVRSMMESPEGYALHPKFVKDLLEIEEKRQKTRYPGLRAPGFSGSLPDLD